MGGTASVPALCFSFENSETPIINQKQQEKYLLQPNEILNAFTKYLF